VAVMGAEATEPRPPGRVRRFVRAHPFGLDLAGVLFLLLAVGMPALVREHRPVAFGFSVALLVPMIWRRRRPTAVFAAVATIAFVQWLVDAHTPADLTLFAALYAVAAYDSRRRAYLAAAVCELGVILAIARWTPSDLGAILTALVFSAGMITAAGALGINVGNRRARLAYLEERAARLERERDQQAQLAAAAERARIARELHDVVAHNLTVMIALADGAAFTLATAPVRAAEAVAAVSDTGREALGEMRRLLGVLRDGPVPAERAPQPGLADVDRLVDQVRRAGLPVAVEISGAPLALSAGAELTVFRLVQEGLTNTLKHAGSGAAARVSLRYHPTGLDVEIIDTGPEDPPAWPARPARPARSAVAPAGQALPAGPARPGGQGLAGMRERVAVYGGTVDAGPRPTGGWRVLARIRPQAGMGSA
jgi:signal transduction histidine kinase